MEREWEEEEEGGRRKGAREKGGGEKIIVSVPIWTGPVTVSRERAHFFQFIPDPRYACFLKRVPQREHRAPQE